MDLPFRGPLSSALQTGNILATIEEEISVDFSPSPSVVESSVKKQRVKHDPLYDSSSDKDFDFDDVDDDPDGQDLALGCLMSNGLVNTYDGDDTSFTTRYLWIYSSNDGNATPGDTTTEVVAVASNSCESALQKKNTERCIAEIPMIYWTPHTRLQVIYIFT